jgi:repressor LexA
VTVHQHIGALVRKGAVQKLAQRSRSIEILDRAFLPQPTIPLLGKIAAGHPIEAVEDVQHFTLAELLPVEPGHSFVLKVSGESMIEDHIADGDLVLVEPRSEARDGDIVVAVVDGEATLKRLYREGPGAWRLQPANASMSPILVRPPQVLEIRGVVRGVLRRY